MLNKISVSVIVTCCNLEKYLPECIESIYAQTKQPTEIIVVHDGCSDLSQCYQGCTNVLRTTHKGVTYSRLEGAKLATSDNLLFVDGDDVLSENFVQAVVNTKIETKANIIYPNVFLWSRWHKDVKLNNGWHESPQEITEDILLKSNPIVVTSLIERDMFYELDGFSNYPMLEDYDFWLKAFFSNYTFAKSVRAVLKYRQRQNSRNHQPDELKNQMYYEIKAKYEKITRD